VDAPATVTGPSHPGQLSMNARQVATSAPRALFLPAPVLRLLAKIAFVTQHSNPRSGRDQEPSRRGRRRALCGRSAGAAGRVSGQPPGLWPAIHGAATTAATRSTC